MIVAFLPCLRLAQPVGPNTCLTEHGLIYALIRPRGTGDSTGEVQQFTSLDGPSGAEAGPDSPLKAVVAACIGVDMQQRQAWTTNGLQNAALSSYAPRAGMLMGDGVTNYFTGFAEGGRAGPRPMTATGPAAGPLDRARQIVRNGVPAHLWTGWSGLTEIGGVHAYLAMQNAAAGRPVRAQVTGTTGDPRFQIVGGDWAHARGLGNTCIWNGSRPG